MLYRENRRLNMPSIAIIGASTDRSKFGNKAVRIYAKKGYKVYPVHPKEKEIEGIKAYPTIADVPDLYLDRISFYVGPAVGLRVIDEVAKKKVGEVWLNPGAESPELIAKAEKMGLHVIAACSLVDIGANPDEFE